MYGCNNISERNTSSDIDRSQVFQETSVFNDTLSNISEGSINTSLIYNFEQKYFVGKLTDDMLKNFIILYSAISNFDKSVDFTEPIESSELDTLMYLLNYDCPELMQISGNYYPEYIDKQYSAVSAVTFEYIMTQDEYKNNIKELGVFFDELKDVLKDKNDFEKEKYVYDYLFNTCIYNETDKFSGSVYGAIIEHKGRCEALSKSFMWCMNELGTECMTILGEPKWDSNSLFASHSWNIIKIDGNYYNVDITLDNISAENSGRTPPSYGFFNVDNKTIFETRTINPIYKNLGIPECNSLDKNYHIVNKQYIDAGTDIRSELKKIITKKLGDDYNNISIKFASKADYEFSADNLDNLISNIIANVSEKPDGYSAYFNELSYTLVLYVKTS